MFVVYYKKSCFVVFFFIFSSIFINLKTPTLNTRDAKTLHNQFEFLLLRINVFVEKNYRNENVICLSRISSFVLMYYSFSYDLRV